MEPCVEVSLIPRVKTGSSGLTEHTLGNSVLGSDRERLLDDIRDHEHGRTVAEQLADDSAGVSHGLKLVHVKLGLDIALTNLEVLLTNAVKNIGTLCHDLEEPSTCAAGGVLRCEEECEDGLGNLVVVEHAKKRLGLLDLVGIALLLSLAPAVGVNHLDDPGVHDTVGLTTSGHLDLALGSSLAELGEDNVGGLLAVPGLAERDDNGEVDELESGGDEVVVVGDLDDSLVGHVVAGEGAEGNGAHELTELGHKRNRLVAIVLCDLNEALEVAIIHLVLTGKVHLEGAAGEEAIEALTEVDVGLAIEEDPVVVSQKLGGDVDYSRLDVAGRVEDLASHITGGGNNDEPVG